jgi:hypothetical protein
MFGCTTKLVVGLLLLIDLSHPESLSLLAIIFLLLLYKPPCEEV